MNPKKRLQNEETQIDVNFHQDVNHSSQFQGLYLTKISREMLLTFYFGIRKPKYILYLMYNDTHCLKIQTTCPIFRKDNLGFLFQKIVKAFSGAFSRAQTFYF